MKLHLWLIAACFALPFSASAQNLSWFTGSWLGETYFPNGTITKRIQIRLEVLKMNGNLFTARLANMYPNDTTVRLERILEGKIANSKMTISRNVETYIRDLRTRNIWKDCSSCAFGSDFSITANQVEIKLTTKDCGDDCNGITIFRKDTSTLNEVEKLQLAKWFHLPIADTHKAAISSKKTNKAFDSSVTKTAVAHQDATIAKITEKKVTANAVVQTQKAAQVINTPAQTQRKTDDTLTPKDSTPAAFSQRVTNLYHSYEVASPVITIQLYDNAEIDGDVVSVYHNGILIADHQTLTHKAITFTIAASQQSRHHEFVLIADNLGLIAPNTALMRITAGKQKFELELSSDMESNAKINIDYTGE